MRHEEYVDWLDRDESVELRKLAERKSYAVTDHIEATRNAVPEPVTVPGPDVHPARRVPGGPVRPRRRPAAHDPCRRRRGRPEDGGPGPGRPPGVADGTDYTLLVVHDGRVVARRSGAVSRPTAIFDDPRVVERGGDCYLNLTAELSRGGSVVTVTATGERLATVAIPADPSVAVSVPFVDRFGRVQVPEDGRLLAVRPDGTPCPDAA